MKFSFITEDIKRKGGYEAKYDALLQENKLLFTLDLIKKKPSWRLLMRPLTARQNP